MDIFVDQTDFEDHISNFQSDRPLDMPQDFNIIGHFYPLVRTSVERSKILRTTLTLSRIKELNDSKLK